MKAVIIDDEISCITSLVAKIQNFVPQIEVVKTYCVPQEALTEINKLDVDVIFLDIEMPGLNGISFAEKANLQDTEIIYTTAFQQYAIDAIRVSAFDFFLKPVNRYDLAKSINRLEEKLKEKKLRDTPKLHTRYNKIAIPSARGIQFIPIQQILWLRADNNYTTLYLIDGAPIISSRTLGDFENLLSKLDFCRIHQSVMINLQHLSEYIRGDGGRVILSNGYELEVSRRRKPELMAIIG